MSTQSDIPLSQANLLIIAKVIHLASVMDPEKPSGKIQTANHNASYAVLTVSTFIQHGTQESVDTMMKLIRSDDKRIISDRKHVGPLIFTYRDLKARLQDVQFTTGGDKYGGWFTGDGADDEDDNTGGGKEKKKRKSFGDIMGVIAIKAVEGLSAGGEVSGAANM